MSELKNCPFCNSKSYIDIYTNGAEFTIYQPRCINCSAGKGGCTDEETAIDSWNTRHESGWISVKDRLPLNNTRVLVTNVRDHFPIVSRYRDINLSENKGHDPWMSPAGDCRVTHWRELPPPPMEDGE